MCTLKSLTFFNGVQDGCKVVVSQDNVGSLLGHIGTGLTHGNTDVGGLERGAVVDTVSGHGDELAAAVESADHPDLGVGRTPGHDQGEVGQGVDLVVGELVELGGGHDHGLGGALGDLGHAGLGQDADLDGDGTGGLGVVAGEHVHRDAGLLAQVHALGGLGARGVVEADQAAEGQVGLELVALGLLLFGNLADVFAVGKGEHAETHAGQGLHVLHDVGDVLVGDGHDAGLCAVLAPDGDGLARRDDALDGALGEDVQVVAGDVLEDDRHLLGVRVERELGDLPPLGLVATGQAQPVPVEPRGVNLDRDLGGVAAGVPFVSRLVHVGQVGKRCDVEVRPERGVLGRLRRVKGCAARVLFVAGHFSRLPRGQAEIANRGVERFIGRAHAVGSTAWHPRLADHHLALGEGTCLVGANVLKLLAIGSEGWPFFFLS